MSLPTSLRAYGDCQELYDKALGDAKGVRACLGTYEACINMRTRMHYFRSLDRKASAEIYSDPKDPKHGTSVYDELVIQLIKDTADEWWLYIQRRDATILAVESLSTGDEIIDGEATEQLAIEHRAAE